VGALDNVQKAQEYIIQVAWELQKSHPQIQFILVGGGSDEAMFRQAAAGLQNLEFTGFVDNVGDYLSAFDLFILPSNKEGIGGILLDAMDQGLAIIASKVGGVPEIVHDGENGILIEPARPDQLKAGILKLKDSPQLRQRYGDRGRQISSEYTAAAMSRKYEALYRSILSQ
jgi:glycosyltransferase involved in cell wall biosynthesis